VAGQDASDIAGIKRALVTGVVLAGGRGARMGGVDKGLQLFEGLPLALHALHKLQHQVGPVMLNANRHLDRYQDFSVPVWPDESPGYAGPLAGFLTALRHCHTPYLVTVPCDSPRFPADLVSRLAQALEDEDHAIAIPSLLACDASGKAAWRPQPVFCLMRTAGLLASLEQYIADGGRKVQAWTARHKTVAVRFETATAFANVNTLAELQALQSGAEPKA
jgi:molybdopterin-guanine dinucleotide biosynthesis protein A